MNKRLLSGLSVFFLLTSCFESGDIITNPASSKEATSPTEINTFPTKTGSPLPTFPPTTTPTKLAWEFDATPTSSNIFGNLDQDTEGKLEITIEGLVKECYQPGDFVPIKMTFHNLTNSTLVIVAFDENWIIEPEVGMIFAEGFLIPNLFTNDNKRVLPEMVEGLHLSNNQEPMLKEIPGNKSLDFLVRFRLPTSTVTVYKDQDFPSLPSGEYLLRLIYIAYEYKNAWAGELSTNQIIICVTD